VDAANGTTFASYALTYDGVGDNASGNQNTVGLLTGVAEYTSQYGSGTVTYTYDPQLYRLLTASPARPLPMRRLAT